MSVDTCPVCGRPPADGRAAAVTCMPTNCPSWRTQAVFDHERHEWLPTDDDGYVPDGRHLSEVR